MSKIYLDVVEVAGSWVGKINPPRMKSGIVSSGALMVKMDPLLTIIFLE